MSWRLFFPGKWPSLNQLNTAKANHHSYHKLKMAWQRPAALIAKAAHIPRLDCAWLTYMHFRKDKRADKSNLASAAMKIIEDALVDAGVLPDDSWAHVEGFEHVFVHSKTQEGIELLIEEAPSSKARDDAA